MTRNLLSILILFVFIVTCTEAQLIREFPPNLPEKFLNIPLNAGRVISFARLPSNDKTFIASMQFGGLWFTNTGGVAWRHLNGLNTIFTRDVAIGKDDRTVIATVIRDNRYNNNWGGIWVSRDLGETWRKPATATPPSSNRVPRQINAHGISFAPDSERKVFVGTDYGVSVSVDNGETWQHFQIPITRAVYVDSTQNAVYSILALPQNKVIALTKEGIWRSDDNAATWRKIRDGNFSFQGGFKLIDVSPYDDTYVYILRDYTEALQYKTDTDAWRSIALPGGASRGPFIRISKAPFRECALWVGAGVNLLRVARGRETRFPEVTAESWTRIGRAEGIHDDTGFLVLSKAGFPCLLGTDGGIFKVVNKSGQTWRNSASALLGMNSYQITDLGGTNIPVGSSFRTTLYFSTQDNAIWSSPNGGRTWNNFDCTEGFHIEVPEEASSAEEVQVAYGRIGCGEVNRFSDDNLTNQRDIPFLDNNGDTIRNPGQAFLIRRNNYIRYGTDNNGSLCVYVSDDNGLGWRKRAVLSGILPAGIFKTYITTGGAIRTYFPVTGDRDTPSGTKSVGLIRLSNPLSTSVGILGTANIIYLPDNGSLGLRATEFDWQAVYGIDPTPGQHVILAPDIVNQVMRISRNGGMTWETDEPLTRLVTLNGTQAIGGRGAYHMQVTHIGYDPYNANRIVVGTRDAGIFFSDDNAASWRKIPSSENALYVTGSFFKPDNTAVFSTYGRGLWSVNFNVYVAPFLPGIIACEDCILVHPNLREIGPLPGFDFSSAEVIIARNGFINSISAKAKQREIHVTPGTVLEYFVSAESNLPEYTVVEDERGSGNQANRKQKISGVVLKNGKVDAYILSSNPLAQNEQEVIASPDPQEPAIPQDTIPGQKPTGINISTATNVGGMAIIDSEQKELVLIVPDALQRYSNEIVISIDQEPVSKQLIIVQGKRMEVKLPEDFPFGLHTLEIKCDCGGQQLVTRQNFVKGHVDHFDKPQEGRK